MSSGSLSRPSTPDCAGAVPQARRPLALERLDDRVHRLLLDERQVLAWDAAPRAEQIRAAMRVVALDVHVIRRQRALRPLIDLLPHRHEAVAPACFARSSPGS